MREDAPFEEYLRRLAPIRADWEDRVVPDEVELLDHFSYRPGYAWMYAYEKDLKRRIEAALDRPLGSFERTLFGSGGCLSEGLSNAWAHGHRRDGRLAIRVRSVVSRRGLAFAVADQGAGFDVETVLRQAARGSGGFYHFAGNGLRTLLARDDLSFAFRDDGRALLLHVPFVRPAPPIPRASKLRS